MSFILLNWLLTSQGYCVWSRIQLIPLFLIQQIAEHEETVRKEPRADFTSQSYWNDVEMVLRRTYDYDLRPESTTLCSVTYFDQCLSLHQCVQSCDQMGASSFRWFHNGCCECAGASCINYGNMYPNCTECMQWQMLIAGVIYTYESAHAQWR